VSRNFHNLHVHAPTARSRAQVVKAVLAFAKKAGFERVKRASGADRVIRLGGKSPWFSVDDDGYGADDIALAISKATKLAVLEAYCEASAIVLLDLHANGRRAGRWSDAATKRPGNKLVAPLLARGTPAELAAKWDEGIRQVFPETALFNAAMQFGIPLPQLVGERPLRGEVIALRRKSKAWTPRYQTGAPAFYVGWGSNQGWGSRHLVFEDEVVGQGVEIASTGGPGRGFEVRFSGTALTGGHIELLEVHHDRMKLERDGNSNTWRDPAAKIPAGFVEQPDTFSMGRREGDKARALASKLAWIVRPTYRAIKPGECDLVTTVSTTGGSGTGTNELYVCSKPWRPSSANLRASNSELFSLHRKEHAIAYITLRGSLADAWTWARPHAEAWARERADDALHIMQDFNVVSQGHYDDRIPFDTIAPAFAGPSTPFRAAGKSWRFGTTTHAPSQMEPHERLAVSLVLFAYDPVNDHSAALAKLEAICDDAIARNVAYSALVVEQQYQPDDTTTGFESICVRDDDPIRVEAWHTTHVRGVDKRVWLSAEHAALLDRAALPDYVTVTPIGRGLRLQVPDDRRRAELEPLITALGALVPTQAEVERWTAARAAPQ
jgi:hypothetical protein